MNEFPVLSPEDFDFGKMKKFAKKDKLIETMWNDLGGTHNALRIVFNSEVLGDSHMEHIYQTL